MLQAEIRSMEEKIEERINTAVEEAINRVSAPLTDRTGEYISRFTTDLEMKVIITEHRFTEGTKLPPELT